MSGEIDRDVPTIVAERAGLLSLSRHTCGQIDKYAAAGRLPGVDAEAMKNAVRAFAQCVATGLHRDGNDPVAVRALMRTIVVEDR